LALSLQPSDRGRRAAGLRQFASGSCACWAGWTAHLHLSDGLWWRATKPARPLS